MSAACHSRITRVYTLVQLVRWAISHRNVPNSLRCLSRCAVKLQFCSTIAAKALGVPALCVAVVIWPTEAQFSRISCQ